MSEYCLDANILITAWLHDYPPRIFRTLWSELLNHKDQLIFISPIWNEIDPIPSNHRNLPPEEKKQKHPLRTWLEENEFTPTDIGDDVQMESLTLEGKYQIGPDTKGAGQNDITLISYAKLYSKTVVTLEKRQAPRPNIVSRYKIPLICQDENVDCINFIEFLDQLGLSA